MPDYIRDIRQLVGHKKLILVVAGALVFDDENRLLLHQRADTGAWGIPGGFMEIGETIQDTARREVAEEVGLTLGALILFAVYSGKAHESILKNGDEVAHVMFVFTCREYRGTVLAHTNESLACGFFPLTALPHPMFTAQQHVFDDLMADRPIPIFD